MIAAGLCLFSVKRISALNISAGNVETNWLRPSGRSAPGARFPKGQGLPERAVAAQMAGLRLAWPRGLSP